MGESLAIKYQLTYSRRRSPLLIAALCLGVLARVQAQSPMTPPVDRTITDRQRQQEMTKREYDLRNFPVERAAADDKQKKVVMAQIEQDFNRILLLHNQIVRAITSELPLDNRFVSDAAGEIKKRSARLQSTLVLPPPEPEKEIPEDSTESAADKLRPELLTLCKYIKNFVTNPIIEKPGTVDADNLTKAKRDLASIVALSGLIRKHADQVRK